MKRYVLRSALLLRSEYFPFYSSPDPISPKPQAVDALPGASPGITMVNASTQMLVATFSGLALGFLGTRPCAEISLGQLPGWG